MKKFVSGILLSYFWFSKDPNFTEPQHYDIQILIHLNNRAGFLDYFFSLQECQQVGYLPPTQKVKYAHCNEKLGCLIIGISLSISMLDFFNPTVRSI